jgi:4-amino-4-deoxy-L-arabinose transferase-like glycosyltransferase
VKNPALHLAILLPLALIVFCMNIGGYDLWPADEPRYGQIAREMMERGDYLVPHINDETYYEKPPLLFWSIAVFSQLTGDVTETTARMPSVVAALLVVLFTYLLAYRMYGPRVALWAALILISTQRIWWQARTAQIDMLLTAALTVGLYALWRWDEERRKGWLFLLYAVVGVGMLAKGPPALLFPFLFIMTYYWKNPDARKRTHWIIGLVSATVMVALWYIPARLAAAEGTQEAVSEGIGGNLFRNIIGRIFLGVSKAQPPWYYVENLPLDLFPWSLFLPFTIYYAWKHRNQDKMMRFLLCWTVPAFIAFSIFIGKRAIYILPLYPAIAILVALSVLTLVDSGRVRWLRTAMGIWAALLAILGFGAYALPATEYAHLFTPGLAGFGALCLVLSFTAAFTAWRRPAPRIPAALAAQFLVLVLAVSLVVLPVVNVVKGASHFCEPLRLLEKQNAEYDLYSVGFSREEFVYYAHHFHTPLLTGLVGVEDIPPEDLMDIGRRIKDLHDEIKDAVEEVPLKNIEEISPEEEAELLAAIQHVITDTKEDRALVDKFEHDLRDAVRDVRERFMASEPVFMMVQDEDWRWLYPLFETPPSYAVIRHEPVGSREVLLLANAAAYDLLSATFSEPPSPSEPAVAS